MGLIQSKLDKKIEELYKFRYFNFRNLLISFKPNYKTATDEEIYIKISFHTINLIERIIIEKMMLSPFVKGLNFRSKDDRDQYGEILKQMMFSFNDKGDFTNKELSEFNHLIEQAKFGEENDG